MQNIHNDQPAAMKIKSKLWIEEGGRPVFGSGRRVLLEAIDRCGSINRAARELNMSYRKAWGSIRAMEERLGIKLIERQTGGRDGGGAVLTKDARTFIKEFEALEKGLQKFVDERFLAVFANRKNERCDSDVR
jgi:molybdate transport system regulatory protein